MGAKLQLALDFIELEEALGLLEKVHSFVDIVELKAKDQREAARALHQICAGWVRR